MQPVLADSSGSKMLLLGSLTVALSLFLGTQLSLCQVVSGPEVKVPPSVLTSGLTPADTTRIADPKLNGGELQISFGLEPIGVQKSVVVEALQGASVVATIFAGNLTGSATPQVVTWDGRDGSNNFVDPGEYQIQVRLSNGLPPALLYPLTIVRLGITEIEAQPSLGSDEWQMVYFMKGTSYIFYTTPAIHEYLSVKDTGEVSDLDLNSGEPRTAAGLHTATAQPAMEGANYEDDRYNYPLCYLMGRQPVFEVTYGAQGTSSASGGAVSANFPVAGFEIRPQAQDGAGSWTTTATSISPGGTATFTGPALPANATRLERLVEWTWQYRAAGDVTWTDLPGSFTTQHRFYTLIGAPQWRTGASGTQYSGPWVEVADYVYTWKDQLGIAVVDQATVVEAIFKGFIGQHPSLTASIEGVIYDCYPMGGDGGATHYFQFSGTNMRLSKLLNNHALGVYVNCSDCSAAASAITAMMGVQNVKMLYLGTMNLKAIWGIGCPDYTLNLWGSGHGFSYHHIVTRFNGDPVCDACMALDVDGSPSTLPGTPGWNCDRPWTGTLGYDFLSSSNAVSRTVETLPYIN
ncbi:MAG: hypothetical protein V2A76_11075 [Planctomycetota bacterium]